MSGFVDNAKGLISIVRDGLITLILITILAVPSFVNGRLTAAGFYEGDIGGFKWKAAVEDNNKQLNEATSVIESLQQQIATTQTALKKSEQAREELARQVKTTMPDTPAAATASAPPPVQTTQILQQNNQVVQSSELRSSVLRQRIQLNDKLLATVPAAKQ